MFPQEWEVKQADLEYAKRKALENLSKPSEKKETN